MYKQNDTVLTSHQKMSRKRENQSENDHKK